MRIQRVWSLNLKPSGPAGYFFSVDGPGCPFALQGLWLHQLELEIAFVDDSPKFWIFVFPNNDEKRSKLR